MKPSTIFAHVPVFFALTACQLWHGSAGTGGSGAGSGGACATCAEYLDSSFDPICDGSNALYSAFVSCTCSGPCATACAADAFCDAAGDREPACDACLADAQNGCSHEHAACAGDTSVP